MSPDTDRQTWMLLDFLLDRSIADLAHMYKRSVTEVEADLRAALFRGGYQPHREGAQRSAESRSGKRRRVSATALR